jgi:hypothetical protein
MDPIYTPCTRSHRAELRRQRSILPRFLFLRNLNACPKPMISQTGSHMGRDEPKRCNQIKIMPFIKASLAEGQSARPKATTLYVYNMSLFLVACLLNRWQRVCIGSLTFIILSRIGGSTCFRQCLALLALFAFVSSHHYHNEFTSSKNTNAKSLPITNNFWNR